ncbi:MAG TPA: FtsX-like permease family protein [Stellaceae bacterium]|nr:FtsX-like permease family protein [Stellaceae bacterium]
MRRRRDIPLDRDGSARFLPWLIALMVYLASLATSGALVLDGALARWDNGLSGTLTVAIPATTADDGVAAALAVLKATPGVTAAAALDRNATAKLVEPWLGSGVSAEELPLPRLIDVRTDVGSTIDFAALRARLAATASGAVLDDHRLWLGRLRGLVLSVEATALAIVSLIGAAAVLTVVFTTHAGLAVHRDVIELLHIMGARDRYIAAQFQREALRLGLTGGLLGLALAVMTLLGLGHAAEAPRALAQGLALLPALQLEPWHWAALAAVPIAAAIIAMLTARFTVLGALARLP